SRYTKTGKAQKRQSRSYSRGGPTPANTVIIGARGNERACVPAFSPLSSCGERGQKAIRRMPPPMPTTAAPFHLSPATVRPKPSRPASVPHDAPAGAVPRPVPVVRDGLPVEGFARGGFRSDRRLSAATPGSVVRVGVVPLLGLFAPARLHHLRD